MCRTTELTSYAAQQPVEELCEGLRVDICISGAKRSILDFGFDPLVSVASLRQRFAQIARAERDLSAIGRQRVSISPGATAVYIEVCVAFAAWNGGEANAL